MATLLAYLYVHCAARAGDPIAIDASAAELPATKRAREMVRSVIVS
jgi:hypothetical protein